MLLSKTQRVQEAISDMSYKRNNTVGANTKLLVLTKARPLHVERKRKG